jgi:hypothetical protein
MRLHLRSIATIITAMAVATCSDGPTAPASSASGGGNRGALGVGRINFEPVFSSAAKAAYAELSQFNLSFDSVHVVLRGFPDTTVIVKDTIIFFTPTSDSLTLNLDVTVQSTNQEFAFGVDYENNGQPIFSGGGTVHAHASDQPAAPEQITVNYVGPGSSVARIAISPHSVTLPASSTETFSVQAFDGAGNALSAVPVAWSSSNTAVGTISQNGVFQPTARGTTTITAATPTGISDAASVTVSAVPSAIVLVSGGGQTGQVGSALPQPAVVSVVDAQGAGVAGVGVNFGAPSGGSVGTSSATTDGSGHASTSLTLGTATGSQGFAASGAGFSVGISETATAGAPAAIAAVSGGGQTDTVRKALAAFVVKVSDQYGNGVSGATVGWARTAGTGSLSAASTTTGSDGTTSVTYTLGGSPESESVSASVSGVTTPATFGAVAVAAAPTNILGLGGNSQSGVVGTALPQPFAVKVVDASGTGVPGIAVTWSATNGTLASATTTTDAQGQTSNTVTLGHTAGTVSATASIAAGKQVAFSASASAGPVAQVVVAQQPANVQAGLTITPAVQVDLRDQYGNGEPTATSAVAVSIGTNPSGGTLTGTLTQNAVAGVATFNDLKIDKPGNGYDLVVAVGGAKATTASFNVTASAAAHLALVGPTSVTVTAGNITLTSLPHVLVTDTVGNGVGSVPIQLHVTGSFIGDTTVTTASDGTFIFAPIAAHNPAAGTYTLTITNTSLQPTSVSFTLTVNPGPAVKLGFQNSIATPDNAGTALPAVVVSVEDAEGNVVSTATNAITLALGTNPSSDTPTGTLTVNAVNGFATFSNVVMHLGGTYTLTATATPAGLTAATSTPFTVSASVATQLVLSPATPTVFTTTAGIRLASPPSVRALDANNNGVAGIPITVAVFDTAAHATIATATLTTDVTGSVALTAVPSLSVARTVDQYRFTATSTSVPSAIVVATLNVVAAPPSQYLIVPSITGTPPAGVELALVAELADSLGNVVPAPGTRTLTWTSSVGGSTFLPTSTSTLLSGVSISSVDFQTASMAMTHHITVTDGTLTGSYDLTTAVIAAQVAKSGTAPAVSGQIGTSVGAPQVTVTNATLAGIPGVVVNFTASAGNVIYLTQGGTASTTISLTTNSSGIAALGDWKLGTHAVANSDTVLVTVPGVSGSPLRFVASASDGATTQLVFSGVPNPSATAVDTLPVITVTAEDAGGNVVTTASGSVTLAVTGGGSGAGTLGGTKTETLVNGVATFSDLSVSAIGSAAYGLTATTTAGSATGTSATFSIAAQTAARLSFVVPATPYYTAKNNSAFTDGIAAQIVDAKGMPVAQSGVTVTAALVPSSESLGSLAIVTNTATTTGPGLATFSPSMRVVGAVQTFQLQFTSTLPVLTSATTPTITLTPGDPVRIDSVGNNTNLQNLGSGTALTTLPAIKIADISGNAVSGVTTTWAKATPCAASFSLGGLTSSSDGTGTATSPTISFAANSAISCGITASISGTVTNNPMTFTEIIEPAGAYVWLGTTSQDWATNANWHGDSLPVANFPAFIPAHTVGSHQPSLPLSPNEGAGSLYTESGAAINLNSQTLTVYGAVSAAGSFSGGGELLLNSSTSSPLFGASLPTTVVGSTNCANAGSYYLSALTNLTGPLTLNCELKVGRDTLISTGDLSTQGSGGVLTMTYHSSTVSVQNATFDGASETDSLTNGTLTINGSFTQMSDNSVSSFWASHDHTVKFTGSGSQVDYISFQQVGEGTGFKNLQVSTVGSSSTSFQTAAQIGNLLVDSYATLAGGNSDHVITVADSVVTHANSSLSGMNYLVLTGNCFPSFGGTSPTLVVLQGSGTEDLKTTATVTGNLYIRQPVRVGADTLTVGGNLTIDQSGQLNMVAGSNVVGDSSVTFNSGGSTISGGSLTIGGSVLAVEDNTTFSASGTRVTFNGTKSQSLPFENGASGGVAFYDLSVSDTAGLGVGTPVTVVDSLNVLNGGRIESTSSAWITVGTGSGGVLAFHPNSTVGPDQTFFSFGTGATCVADGGILGTLTSGVINTNPFPSLATFCTSTSGLSDFDLSMRPAAFNVAPSLNPRTVANPPRRSAFSLH